MISLGMSSVTWKGVSLCPDVSVHPLSPTLSSLTPLRSCLHPRIYTQTTNKLLESGEAALACRSAEAIPQLAPLREVMELHRRTCEELGLDEEVKVEVESLLKDLQQLLIGVNMLQELTPR
jgi:aspartate kinase